MVFAAAFAIALFVFIPVFTAGWLKRFIGDSSLAFVVLDGIIRLGLIVGYIWLVSRWDEIQRVFQYHGAEHKTIHAYENGDPLDIDRIQAYSPRHPRCGTSFLLIVGMVAFVVFLTLAPLPFAWQAVARLVLIPVIAGLSYEVLKAGATSRWLSWANRPGIWLQAITTKEPDDSMVEVAVASIMAALSAEEADIVLARGAIAPGATAVELGLADEPAPDGEAVTRAVDLARSVCAKASPSALAATKALLNESVGLGWREALENAAAANIRQRGQPDCRLGVRAFLDTKSTPDWLDAGDETD